MKFFNIRNSGLINGHESLANQTDLPPNEVGEFVANVSSEMTKLPTHFQVEPQLILKLYPSYQPYQAENHPRESPVP